MTEPRPGSTDPHALYVYAVCREVPEKALAGMAGVAQEESVRPLPFGTLTAIVQTVRAAEFTDEAWQERMADERALERYARAHHDVVTAVAASGPIVPLPMATLYHGDERARQALAAESERFRAALERLAHHAEWGVKVYASSPSADDGPAPSPERPGAPAGRTRPAPGAGLAYLERKRSLQARRDQRQDDALRIAESVDAEVRGLATAHRRLRPHGQRLSGDPRTQVLNATYLIAEHRVDELAQLARTLRERTGAEIELSGPWVPYSFVGEVTA